MIYPRSIRALAGLTLDAARVPGAVLDMAAASLRGSRFGQAWDAAVVAALAEFEGDDADMDYESCPCCMDDGATP